MARTSDNGSRISAGEQDVVRTVRTHLSVATKLARRYRNRGVDLTTCAPPFVIDVIRVGFSRRTT